MRYVIYDIETKSTANLNLVGSHIYTCDPTTDIWCLSWCIVTNGVRGPISTWTISDPVPAEILKIHADPDTLIVAFNDAFERQVEQHILHLRYGWPIFPLERRRCAQAAALARGLPASLDAVAAALKLKVRKTAEGKRVMRALALPRKLRKGEDPSQTYWHDTPERLAILHEYNRIDTEITAAVVAITGFLTPAEQAIWEMDAAINARGICIDKELLDAALEIAEQASIELGEKLAALTDGEITSPAQRDRILEWLTRHRYALPNVRKPTLPQHLRTPISHRRSNNCSRFVSMAPMPLLTSSPPCAAGSMTTDASVMSIDIMAQCRVDLRRSAHRCRISRSPRSRILPAQLLPCAPAASHTCGLTITGRWRSSAISPAPK